MPWVAACLDLLAGPLFGYCLAVRKLALHVGILHEAGVVANSSVGIGNKAMTPSVESKNCAEEVHKGENIQCNKINSWISKFTYRFSESSGHVITKYTYKFTKFCFLSSRERCWYGKLDFATLRQDG